jgi:crotonobetainyl-CoA:carnitine CoA-transferase CaiB-like acyl-CoA transferase
LKTHQEVIDGDRIAVRVPDAFQDGTWEFTGPPIHLSASTVEMKHAPLLGQHSLDVLQQELSPSAEALARLGDQGVVGARQEPGRRAAEAAGSRQG